LPGYFDGYEEVFARGQGIATANFGYAMAPIWFNGDSADILGVIRARPGQVNQDIMIHLVDCGDLYSNGFNVVIDPNQFFNGAPIKFHIFRPKPYDESAHQRVIDGIDAPTELRQFAYLTPTIRSDGRLELSIPPIEPWGILRIQLQ
jgi:hypothetical protein